jgi:hypothetical protein
MAVKISKYCETICREKRRILEVEFTKEEAGAIKLLTKAFDEIDLVNGINNIVGRCDLKKILLFGFFPAYKIIDCPYVHMDMDYSEKFSVRMMLSSDVEFSWFMDKLELFRKFYKSDDKLDYYTKPMQDKNGIIW